MKKIDNIEYKRIDYEKYADIIKNLTDELKDETDIEKFLKIVKEIIEIQNEIEEMCDYADIQNMRYLDDEFYKDEMSYWNNYKPKFDLLFVPFYKIMINTKFKNELKDLIPENFFNTISYNLKITSDKVIELKQRENELKMQYRSLSKNSILYDGEYLTIPKISRFFTNDDRSVRKKVHDAVNNYYYSNKDEYINILYNLINVRNKIAKQLGFSDYSEYSLYNLRRFGYNYSDIKIFRDNVVKYFIPLCDYLSEFKKKELGITSLAYYDTILFKKSPEIKYSNQELLENMQDSFANINDELASFFKDMLENGYIDFCTRDNKVNFSITNYLVCEKMPVITGNYKGNYGDVLTTTHEMGHSFQKYLAGIEDEKHVVSPLLKYPTYEIAEMFSYAMQLIATDYVDNIFSEDVKKYKFLCIYNLITMMPYICLIDEFQETIYKKEDLDKDEISSIFIDLSKKYGLYNGYKGNLNLESGNYYFRQTHVYSDPFYYIDYALSYFGAFAIWNKNDESMSLFKKLAAVASYYPFKEMIDLYNMPSPFEEENFKDISKMLKKKIDELKL